MAVSQSLLNQVQELYIAFYDRPADLGGLNYWANTVQTAYNGNVQGILSDFANSAESQNFYGTITSANVSNVINQIYLDLFNRTADSVGTQYWTNAYNTYHMSAGELAYDILNGAGPGDSTTIANKLYAANQFTNALGSSYSSDYITAAHGFINQVGYYTDLSNITPQYVQSYINSSTTSFNAATFNLTTGIDNLAPLVGNATFNAIIDSTPGSTDSTLNPLDSITATGTGNVLNIYDKDANGSIFPSGVSVSGVQTVNILSSGVSTSNDFTNWTGLTTLNDKEAGGMLAGGITAAGTTAINITDSALAAGAILVKGGSNVSVVAQGQTSGTITIGTTTAPPTGTVAVSNTVSSGPAGAITITGGTTVTVNETNSNAVGTTVTESNVTVNGSASTTSVSVNQAYAIAAPPATAQAGTVQTNAVTAAPGVNGVTGVATTAAPITASAGVAGATPGSVTITDANYITTNPNSITTVSLNNYGAAIINDNALTNLSLGGNGGGVTINDATNPNSTLNLTVTNLNDSTGLVDANNKIKTINVTTAGTTKSTLNSIGDSSLTTLNISGSQVFALNTVPSSLANLTVTGAAGFIGDISSTAITSFDPASSGLINVVLSDTGAASTNISFTGSTGQDIVTISADLAKGVTIAGGSATNNEIILNGDANTFLLPTALTPTHISGFSILGVEGASATEQYNMSLLPSGFNAIDIVSVENTGVEYQFTNVAAGTSLSIDQVAAGLANSPTILYQTSDANGGNDSATINLGTAKTTGPTGIVVGSLTLSDANSVGIGTLTIVSNDSTWDSNNIITTLTDNGLSTLHISGNSGLYIDTLSETIHQATALTLDNNTTGVYGLNIGILDDANLGTLNFTGTGATQIGTLKTYDNATTYVKVLTINDNASGNVSIGAISDGQQLTSLTLNGNVAFGTNTTTANTAIGSSTGITVNAANDNAHINLTLKGADAVVAAGATDNITVGNANNYITDLSTTGTVNITVGTGYNLIDVHTGGNNATYMANITLGAHTDTASLYDEIFVSPTGSQASGVSAVINGIASGDHIVFNDANPLYLVTLTNAQQTQISNAANLAAAITDAFADTGTAHSVLTFQYQGNTYAIENVGADTAFDSGADTVIELVGAHTISSVAPATIAGTTYGAAVIH